MRTFVQNLRRVLRVCSILRSPWNEATEGLRSLSPVNETESRLGMADAITGDAGGLVLTESLLLKGLVKRGKLPDEGSGEDPGVVLGDSLFIGGVAKRGSILGDIPGLLGGLFGDGLLLNGFNENRGESDIVSV